MYRQVMGMLVVVLLAAPPLQAQERRTTPAAGNPAATLEEGEASADGQSLEGPSLEELLGEPPVEEDGEAVTPRSTNSRCDYERRGSLANGTNISMCARVDTTTPPRIAHARLWVLFGPNATRATACKLTGWVKLFKGTGTWESPRKTVSCTSALQHRNTWSAPVYTNTGTSATYAEAHGCIDLYFNSPNSGAQVCYNSQKVGW